MASDTVIDLVSSSDEEAPADPPEGNASTSSRKRRRSGSNEAMQQSGEKMSPAKKMRIKLTFSRKGNPHRADRSSASLPKSKPQPSPPSANGAVRAPANGSSAGGGKTKFKPVATFSIPAKIYNCPMMFDVAQSSFHHEVVPQLSETQGIDNVVSQCFRLVHLKAAQVPEIRTLELLLDVGLTFYPVPSSVWRLLHYMLENFPEYTVQIEANKPRDRLLERILNTITKNMKTVSGKSEGFNNYMKPLSFFKALLEAEVPYLEDRRRYRYEKKGRRRPLEWYNQESSMGRMGVALGVFWLSIDEATVPPEALANCTNYKHHPVVFSVQNTTSIILRLLKEAWNLGRVHWGQVGTKEFDTPFPDRRAYYKGKQSWPLKNMTDKFLWDIGLAYTKLSRKVAHVFEATVGNEVKRNITVFASEISLSWLNSSQTEAMESATTTGPGKGDGLGGKSPALAPLNPVGAINRGFVNASVPSLSVETPEPRLAPRSELPEGSRPFDASHFQPRVQCKAKAKGDRAKTGESYPLKARIHETGPSSITVSPRPVDGLYLVPIVDESFQLKWIPSQLRVALYRNGGVSKRNEQVIAAKIQYRKRIDACWNRVVLSAASKSTIVKGILSEEEDAFNVKLPIEHFTTCFQEQLETEAGTNMFSRAAIVKKTDLGDIKNDFKAYSLVSHTDFVWTIERYRPV